MQMRNVRTARRRAAGILALAMVVATTGCTVIEDGEVGVSKRFGSISDDPVDPGVKFVLPVAREIETWNVKTQEVKEQADVPSSEGLIVGLDTSILFRVKPAQAPELRKRVGRNYLSVLVIPYLRNAVRDVVSAYEVKNIYSESGRKEIAARMLEYLRENLDSRGIEVEQVLLRDVKLPQRFKESIEAKLAAEQKAEQKRFELDQARKDAEIEVARAEGAAKAQQIIRATLSEPYLHYLWIQTLSQNPNVIYVATESNLPIFKSVK